MYKVLCDNALMCNSQIEELALINPVLKLEENKAGSFSFIIPPNHPRYDAIKKRKSLVQVFRDDELLFSGVCVEETKDFYKQKKVVCEGELTFFNDSIQRPARHKGMTVRGLLEAYIANHNVQVEESKQFVVGAVTVQDSNDYISCYTNMESTMQALKEDLVDDLGGIFRIRHEDGVRYLDYLTQSPNINSQVIRLGENLVNFNSNLDTTKIATAVIPLGTVLDESEVEGLDTRLTIKAVNEGLDYVFSPDAVDAYGWIYKTVEFDDVTTPTALKRKGEQYLSEIQFENMVLEAKAIDLHLADKGIEQFKLSDMVRVVSVPHGLDRYFRLTKMTINLNNPEKDTITLGKSERLSLSAKSSQANAELKKAMESIVPQSTILKNATELITKAMGGYVVKTNEELLIMDTDNIETAKKVWRWNINGLGYSSTGYYGEYALAMTMDGHIVADFLHGGTITAGGEDNVRGTIKVLNEYGEVIGKWGSDGLEAEGTFENHADDMWGYNGVCTAKMGNGAFYLYDKRGLLGSFESWNEGTLGEENLGNLSVFALTDKLLFGFIRELIDNELGVETIGKEVDIYYQINNLENPGMEGQPRHLFTDNVAVHGDFTCTGSSTAQANTVDYGTRKLNHLATAEAYFSDMGSGVIGYDGTCTIEFEEIFSETVDLNADYKVFITPTSQSNGLWVAKNAGNFTVYGTEGATFDWAIYCKQLWHSDARLEKVEG